MTTRTTSFAASTEPARAGRTRAIAAVCLGNALEFYDFLVYSLLATLMARLFFPFGENPLTSLMLSFAVFGTGFIMRPLGGLLIGLYADRAGRKAAMRLTLWLMALGALLFTVAPTYAQAGLVGPLVIIVARLLQGFAVGGQVGTATTILMEYAGSGSRAYYCSWQVFSQSLGTIMGALVVLTLSNLLSPEAMDSWGWRAVFAVGILAIPVSEYIRHRLEETLPATAQGDSRQAREGGLALLCRHPRQLLTGVLLVIGVSVPVYITQFYLANHAISVLGMPLGVATWAAVVSSLPSLLLAPHAGRLSDRIGRRRSIFWPLPILLLATYPAFLLLNQWPSIGLLLLIVGLLNIPLTYGMVASLAILPELFPAAIRATGLSVTYCVGVALFGGFAQFFAAGLIDLTGSPNAPAWYLVGAILLCLAGLRMAPETVGRTLD
ncbi:MFS transporter [Pseudomonas citronellolis]|uniref:MFS transporter n=1 Tax=Pseudomonas citronellolis TaxID=53408 RepID=UPI00209DF1EF|nr:MFS transporter [Pseudomonas citronellolis]MCP1644831.1 MFS family permease [Pseudomonas citronellolis]MCP1664980.1 MFS family permease [Pseudomonas citronellolis]MCP1698985.1 MFS family permease [Pseudomonas citronellolis]MCP1705645.1 MFS family permease [Pseudomonas citronellolis]MCP1799414.1 MFS family permease [Pseudomonas citronellolis]